MIVLLFTVLFLMFLIHILMYKTDWMSPTILSLLSYILSVGILLLNSNEWNVTISGKVFVVIVVGFLFLSWGELVSRYIFYNRKAKKNKQSRMVKKIIKPNSIVTNLIILFMIITVILYYQHINNTVYINTGDEIDTLLGAYRSISDIQMNPVLRLSIIISLPIAYYYLYVCIENYIYMSTIKKKYLIPIILYVIIEALSSARIGMLYLVVVAVSISFLLYQEKKDWNLKINFKLIFKIILLMALSLLLFYLLGFLTGKSEENDFYYTISLYIGTPVVALSKYLENFTYFFRNFGEETLIGLNNFMSTLNIKINMGNAARNHEFVRLGNMPTRTNIYTSFRSILNDYGYLGMLFYQFSVGFFISYIYEKIKRDHSVNQSFQILIYAFIIRYLFFQFTNERILINLFTTTTILRITTMYLLVKISSYEINNNIND